MRHIRDPITGYCIICEKNNIRHFVAPNELDVDDSVSVHGSDRPLSSRRGTQPGKKTIYVSSNPSSSPRPTSSISISSDSSDEYVPKTRYSSRSTARSTSKLILVEHGNASPPPRYGKNGGASTGNRSPSPSPAGKRSGMSPNRGNNGQQDPESGCFKRCCRPKNQGNGRFSKGYDSSYDASDRCCGYRNFETASFGAGTWGIRRWCAPFIVLLVLAALAGLATGIYFGAKSAKETAQRKQSVKNFVKTGTQAKYIIQGVDQPCNKANNNPSRTGFGISTFSPYPNCNSTTTKIVPATQKFVPPTDPDWAIYLDMISGGSKTTSFSIFGILIFELIFRALFSDHLRLILNFA